MLSETTLQALLGNKDLTQLDKILCCLAIEPDTPKRVNAIKALATRNGLSEIKRWNVSTRLTQKSKFAFKTGEGWELTTAGLARVEALSGLVSDAPGLSASLAGQSVDEPVRIHRILIIESDPHTMQLLEFIFGRANYDVFTTVDGREAQGFLQNQPPVDLIVTGLMMPYVTGYQIIIDARQNRAWMHVPIIVLSGKVLEMDVVRALDLGANDYVSKPFRPRELLARARRLLATYELLPKPE